MTIAEVEATVALNRAGLRQYIDRVGDRWLLDGAYIGGSALTGDHLSGSGSGSESDLLGTAESNLLGAGHASDMLGGYADEQPPEFTVVLVSDAFGDIPWFERIYVASSLWDALEMGAPAKVHCYTHTEFERKRESSAWLRDTIWHGLDLLALI